jgi:hypothetical protein
MGFKSMNNKTFNAAMSERDFKKVKLDGRVYWRGLNLIITKIDDINKTASREIVDDSRELVESKTAPREIVEGFMDILKRYKNNGDSSCSIDTIEKEVSSLLSTNSLDTEYNPTNSLLKTDYDKNLILDEMKGHYEGSTGEFLTGKNLKMYAMFVHKKYDKYSIYDIMVDAKNKYKLEVTA